MKSIMTIAFLCLTTITTQAQEFFKDSNGKLGLKDSTGRVIIIPKYDEALDFVEGLSRVKLNGKYGFIDKTGKEIVPLIYDEIFVSTEGLAKVKLNNKYGFIDRQTGKEVIPPKYDFARPFSEGLAGFRVGDFNTGKWGVIDKSGKEIISPKYDRFIEEFSQRRAKVKLGERYFYIDKTGKEIQ